MIGTHRATVSWVLVGPIEINSSTLPWNWHRTTQIKQMRVDVWHAITNWREEATCELQLHRLR